MNTVTYDQVIAMNPCWCETDKGRHRLKRYADRLGGKIDDQQLAAAQAAARGVARAVTWAAAESAAEAAAWAAGRAAAWDAAKAAARGATGEAERAWQITDLTNMLQEAD